MGAVVRLLGGRLPAPHTHGWGPDRIIFREAARGVEADRPEKMVRVWVPVDVGLGRILKWEICYRNHPGADKTVDEIMVDARADVGKGRAIVFICSARGT